MSTYRIAYNHTAAASADSIAEAKDIVRDELRRVSQTAHGADNMVTVRFENGLYVYEDQEEADADDTGTLAFAIISRAEDDEE